MEQDARARYDGRRLLRNDVYELVLERILSGELPPGQRLRDADLTSWLGVSRTPVREAVSRLTAVGLMSTSPNRYTEVAALDETEIADAVAVLRLLWPAALAGDPGDSALEREVELTLLARRVERGDLDPAHGLHQALSVVVDTLSNRVLAEAVRAADLRVVRYLLLEPEARAVLQRDRAVALIRALGAETPPPEGAGRADELGADLLAELEGVLASRRSAAR
ncbi:GntR family transcriptional regulator [Leifsonia sp. 1010]|uniref:GntR family transcriptional regulator n=1 Tax=Leifsonia sp. 1010 TaxID=2817769 RepID=UPI002865A392|nr:GntR family transcriptional regulator [Leifsonia sp. 1010]MDR6611595.1 DNA-binding GntR family transcriptional regulator [Leifsonia sp. 1010]